jgi:hypothetical protein
MLLSVLAYLGVTGGALFDMDGVAEQPDALWDEMKEAVRLSGSGSLPIILRPA